LFLDRTSSCPCLQSAHSLPYHDKVAHDMSPCIAHISSEPHSLE